MTTDWIEHHGKSDPDLPAGTLVMIRCRSGVTSDICPFEDFGIEDIEGKLAKSWWVHQGEWFDITHYRIVRPAAPAPRHPEMTARDVGSVIETGYMNRLMPPEGDEE